MYSDTSAAALPEYNRATLASTPKVSAVPAAVQTSNGLATALHSLLDDLETRLSYICNSHPLPEKKQDRPAASSQLHGELLNINENLDGAISRVKNILGSLTI